MISKDTPSLSSTVILQKTIMVKESQNLVNLSKDISTQIRSAWGAVAKIEDLSYSLNRENNYYDEGKYSVNPVTIWI